MINFKHSGKEDGKEDKVLIKAACYFAFKDEQYVNELNYSNRLISGIKKSDKEEMKNHTRSFFEQYENIFS